jgi:HD superfamily phosphodiesterase
MTIYEIYEKYHIMPNLQLHQLRVAAVAEQICEGFDVVIDKDAVVKACLLHDMGNIVKSDFSVFPESFYLPEGSAYWKNIKEQYVIKYGTDDHHATLVIARELGVSQNVIECIDGINLFRSEEHKNAKEFEKKLCYYVDMRVGPHGVLSLAERIHDTNERYRPISDEKTNKAREISVGNLHEIEKQIFSHTNIKPEDITDESIKHRIETLRNTNIL